MEPRCRLYYKIWGDLPTSGASILWHSVFRNWFSGLWRRVALYFWKCFIKRHCLLLWLYTGSDRWVWSSGGVIMRGSNRSTWSETCTSSTLPTKILIFTGPPSNTDPCGEKPATHRRGHDAGCETLSLNASDPPNWYTASQAEKGSRVCGVPSYAFECTGYVYINKYANEIKKMNKCIPFRNDYQSHITSAMQLFTVWINPKCVCLPSINFRTNQLEKNT